MNPDAFTRPKPIVCPFCLDDDFDEYGLKFHIEAGHCEAWNGLSEEHRHKEIIWSADDGMWISP